MYRQRTLTWRGATARAVAALALASAATSARAASPFGDDFNGPTLNPGWTAASPNPASSISLTGSGNLEMVASWANGGSDLYAGSNYNGDRILQAIDPVLDWTITTELNFAPTDDYQGAGILLSTTTGTFTSQLQYSRVIERAFYPAGGGNIVESSAGTALYSTDDIFLRVTKSGDEYTTSYSSDGATYTILGTTIDPTVYTSIGLFALRQPWDGQSVNSVADFNFFDVSLASSTPEASTWMMLLTGFGGLGLVDWRGRRQSRALT